MKLIKMGNSHSDLLEKMSAYQDDVEIIGAISHALEQAKRKDWQQALKALEKATWMIEDTMAPRAPEGLGFEGSPDLMEPANPMLDRGIGEY